MAQEDRPFREQTIQIHGTDLTIESYRLDFSEEAGGGNGFVTEATVTDENGEKINVLPPFISDTIEDVDRTETGIRAYADRNSDRIEDLSHEAGGLERNEGYAEIFSGETEYGNLTAYARFDADAFSEEGAPDSGTTRIYIEATPSISVPVEEFASSGIQISPEGELTGPVLDTAERYASDMDALRDAAADTITDRDIEKAGVWAETGSDGRYTEDTVAEYFDRLADIAEDYRENGIDAGVYDETADAGEFPWFLGLDDIDTYNELSRADGDHSLIMTDRHENQVETEYGLASIRTEVFEHAGGAAKDSFAGAVTTVTLTGGTDEPFTVRVDFSRDADSAEENHADAVDMAKNPNLIENAVGIRVEEYEYYPDSNPADVIRSARFDMGVIAERQEERLDTLGRVPGVEVETQITDSMHHEIEVEGGVVTVDGSGPGPARPWESITVSFEGEDGEVRRLGIVDCGADDAAHLESAFISHADNPAFITRMEEHPERLSDIAFGLDPDSAPEAIMDVSQSGTMDDLRELLSPYFDGDGLDAVCGPVMEAAESGVLSENFDPEFLSRILDDISNNPSLTDDGKEELRSIVIEEAAINPGFEDACNVLDDLAKYGDIKGTLDEIDTTAYYFKDGNLPQELNERVTDFFNDLADGYTADMNDRIFDAIEDLVANHPDRIEEMALTGGEGIQDLDRMIDYAFQGEEGCDQRLLDIRDTIREFAWVDGEIDSREEAIERVTALLDEYREDRGYTDRYEYSFGDGTGFSDVTRDDISQDDGEPVTIHELEDSISDWADEEKAAAAEQEIDDMIKDILNGGDSPVDISSDEKDGVDAGADTDDDDVETGPDALQDDDDPRDSVD